jgi:large subunit ribosomal protein L32
LLFLDIHWAYKDLDEEVEESAMLPVQKHSKSRKRKRRAHLALKPIHYVRCPQCGNAKLPHCACDNCGYVNPKLALQMDQEAS